MNESLKLSTQIVQAFISYTPKRLLDSLLALRSDAAPHYLRFG